MRNLIFGTLKVVEVILAFVVVAFLAWVVNFDVFVDWLISISPILFWIVDLGVFTYCLISLIRSGFFTNWFKSNWIWTDQIISVLKKRRQKIIMNLRTNDY